MSDDKPQPSEFLKELLKAMQEKSDQEVEVTLASGRFTQAFLKNAAVRKIDQMAFFMSLVNMYAVVLEHTDFTPGDVLDGAIRVWHDEKLMGSLTKLMKEAGLDFGEPCELCGRRHPNAVKVPEAPPDPSKCN